MLNHTYTSVKNANLVDCGKKQHIPSTPSPLLRDNYLGEFRTELDKKKVLANLGIATDLSLEWEYIKGDIGRSEALMGELDSRTKYVSSIDGFEKSVIQGIQYLETIVGGEQEGEEEQNDRLEALENAQESITSNLTEIREYLQNNIEVDIDLLNQKLEEVTQLLNNITDLIQVSNKSGNALTLLSSEDVAEGETPGLYVPDLSNEVSKIAGLRTDVDSILDTYVTKEELGGGDFDFVKLDDFDEVVDQIQDIEEELANTVKTGEDGHVDTLFVNTISKNNDDGNILITDSFEVTTDIPLDIRFVRENLEELYKLPVKICYPGMGVVVNSLSSLYILRKPAEGIALTQEYIANPNNWKCPEDLVTMALTREEYEALEEVNPNVFYYVYEDEITRTQEPKREEYLSDKEYEQALQEWIDSLKTLSQEYMSASWGVDIENKLGKKASSLSVSILMEEINNIKGNGVNPSLESLNNSVNELHEKDTQFKERVDEILVKYEDIEQGRLVNVEKEITQVKDGLNNYVTKEFIQDGSNNFIFLEKEDYQEDQDTFKQELASNVTTEEVTTNTINLGGSTLNTSGDRLHYNELPVAKVSDIPVIEIISQKQYDDMVNKDENTYYYTFDGDDIYVTKQDLSREAAKLQSQINVLFDGGTAEDIEGALDTIFVPITVWNTFLQDYLKLSELAQDLANRLIKIEPVRFNLTDNTLYIIGDPERCYQDGDTIYINQTAYADTLKFE